MPTKETITLGSFNSKSTKDLSQEHGLFDSSGKDETDALDHQQRYDNSIQESEIARGDSDLEESPSDDKNFTQNFSRYSKNLQDNADGAPGADDDYGVYTDPKRPEVEVDVEDVADDEALTEADDQSMENNKDI